MPLNEAEGFHRTSLTEKEQQEAMQQLYGLEKEPMTPVSDLTYEERVRMRRHLDQLDQKEASGGQKDFDLNKPPAAPYVYREFPFLMYHPLEKRTQPAHNPDERERMLAAGWSTNPFCADDRPEIPLTAAEHAEAEEINSKLEKKKR